MKEKRRNKMKRTFYIAGVQFRPKNEIAQAIKQMQVGDVLVLTLESTNSFDINAVKIEYNKEVSDGVDSIFLGYVPRKYSSEVTGMLEIGALIKCTVDEINPLAETYKMIKVTVQTPIDNFENEGDKK